VASNEEEQREVVVFVCIGETGRAMPRRRVRRSELRRSDRQPVGGKRRSRR